MTAAEPFVVAVVPSGGLSLNRNKALSPRVSGPGWSKLCGVVSIGRRARFTSACPTYGRSLMTRRYTVAWFSHDRTEAQPPSSTLANAHVARAWGDAPTVSFAPACARSHALPPLS